MIQACVRGAIHQRSNAGAEGGDAGTGASREFGLCAGNQRAGRLRMREDEGQTGAPGRFDQVEVAAPARHADQCSNARLDEAANEEVSDGWHAERN